MVLVAKLKRYGSLEAGLPSLTLGFGYSLPPGTAPNSIPLVRNKSNSTGAMSWIDKGLKAASRRRPARSKRKLARCLVTGTENEGKAEKVEGRVRSGVGKAMDAVREVVNDEK